MKRDRFFLHSEGINRIRDEIINVVYLASGIVGTFSFYSFIIRVVKQGYSPLLIFHTFLFIAVWTIFLLRKFVPTHWKSGIFFVLFFLVGTFLNLENTIISGAVNFILVSTIITLLYGWRLGAISIILSVIVRSIIAILYYKGILEIGYDLNKAIVSPPILFSVILGAMFTAAVLVFAINKFYQWLLNTLEAITNKVIELEQINKELDIAKSKAIENDRLKTVFLTNMSHEVRTPMNAIIGFSNLLGKPSLDDTKRVKFSALVKRRSYDLLRLIEDILDISKIEIGQLRIIESETNLRKIMDETYEFYSLKMKKNGSSKNLKIKLQIDESIENRNVLIDQQRIKQVLNNLIENALKFTKQGSIEMGCSINKQIHFFVKDTGIGIPLDKQKIIFDRFRQADDSYTHRKYGGTGLGLSICKGILDLMGGDIYLQSEKDQGSTFFFSIPLKEVKDNKETLVPTSDAEVNYKGKALLIVEDDLASARFMRETLLGTNIQIFHCSTFAESIKTLEKEPSIEILLLDIRLPDRNGLELAKKLRMENSKITIIAQTAYASGDDINECMNAGCDDFIAKPVDPSNLLRKIDNYLKG